MMAKCKYCGSKLIFGKRGGCSACGAPNIPKEKKTKEVKYENIGNIKKNEEKYALSPSKGKMKQHHSLWIFTFVILLIMMLCTISLPGQYIDTEHMKNFGCEENYIIEFAPSSTGETTKYIADTYIFFGASSSIRLSDCTNVSLSIGQDDLLVVNEIKH